MPGSLGDKTLDNAVEASNYKPNHSLFRIIRRKDNILKEVEKRECNRICALRKQKWTQLGEETKPCGSREGQGGCKQSIITLICEDALMKTISLCTNL